MKIKCLILVLIFTLFKNTTAQTSWKGTTSTSWSTASNWTAGVPSASVDAVIGNASFTGSFQPTLTATSTCKNLTIGGTVASTLTIGRNLTISGNLLLNANGTILASSGRTITIRGNWSNSGTYTATSSSSRVTFSGVSQTLTGTTAFRNLTINSGTTLTLANNISVVNGMTVSGTMNPTALYTVSGTGNLTLSSTGILFVHTATFAGNYSLSGSKSLSGTSTVNYASAVTNQTISNALTYGILRISGGSTKSLSANLPSLSSSSSSSGKIFIDAGILDLNSFTANRNSSGGAFTIASNATLRIGGTNGFPSNYSTLSFATTSTVEYYGNNQTILAAAYGNLVLGATSGSVTKTMPAAAMTIAGNFTASLGTGAALAFTAGQNITVNKDITIGSGCTFNASSYTHTLRNHWINNGTFNGNTSTLSFNGISGNLSGTGANNFNNLIFTAPGITANSNTNLNVSGNLSTTTPGLFSHQPGGSLTMTGSGKTLTGNGFQFSNFIVTGTVTGTANMTITGNMTNNGTFSATSGVIKMNGIAKSINGSNACTFYTLNIEGEVTTSNSFTIKSNLSIALTGNFLATSGTAYFDGSGSLSGVANLYNVTINATRLLTLSSSSVLGIASVFTKDGTLDVTSITPNSVDYNGSGNQTIVGATYYNLDLSNGGTKTPSTAVTVNNDLTIDSAVSFNGASYVLSLYRHWNNNGTFIASTSDVQLRGANAATISGITTFNDLTVNKSTSLISVTLEDNIIANNVIMTTGNMFTGLNSITTTSGRTGNGIIIGTVVHSHIFLNNTAYSFEGPNNLITFNNPIGITSVSITSKQGEITDFDPSIECVTREYEISIPVGSYTDAKLRFHYENNELNAFAEPFLSIYKFNAGIVWDSIGFSLRDTANNYVEQSGINILEGRFASSGTRNIVRWNGSVSTDWNDVLNWTTVSGASMINRVPTATDAATLGEGTFMNAPTISSTQNVSVLRFGSTQATTLTINGGILTTSGSLRGKWTSSQSHIIDVVSGMLNVGTHLLLSDSAAGHDITLKIGSGTVNTNYNLIQTATGAISFTGSGSLNVSGDYNYSSGSFNAGTGTVIYSGGESQNVAPIVYNNLTFTKTTERASISSSTIVNGNLTINNSGEVAVFDTLTVGGNIIIGNSTTLLNESAVINLSGNWLNNGNYICNSGSINFNGTGDQTINSSTFSNIIVNKPSGNLQLTDNIEVNENLNITAGIFLIDTFFANRSSVGGVLTLGPGAELKLAGFNNFPGNYLAVNLDQASTVTYNGVIGQSIYTTTYGNLRIENGGSLPKTILGNTGVNGDLVISSGSTLNPDITSINLYGNFENNGTYTPGTSTLNLYGSSKTITGTTTLNNLSVIAGSYTVNSGTISMAGDLYIESGGALNFGNNTAILDGDLTNKGTLTSNGTATFTGNRVQTIQLLNSISSTSTGIINFNGTVSPIINSTSSPAFATVNINNTSGITASVPWFVYFACTIASGSTFNGGPHNHTFYGNFTNNGTVLSSGKLKFSPGAPFSASGTVRLDGTSFASTGEIEFAGTAPLTILNNSPVLNIVTVSNTNASGVTLPSSWTISDELRVLNGATLHGGSSTSHLISGSLLNNGTIIGESSTFRFDGNPVEINGTGITTFNDLKIESSADLTLNNTININNNFIVDGNFNGYAGNVVFTGSSTSVISGSAASVTFGDLEQAKSGSYNTSLSLPVSVTGDLTLTNGVIVTTSANSLTIEDDASSTAGNATSYVSGPMKKVGDDAYVFPLGKGGKWARLGISAPSSVTDVFTAEYYNTPFSDTTSMATTPSPVLNNVSTREYWNCDRTVGSSNVKVQLFWQNGADGVHYYTSDLVVAHWNGSAWENVGQSAITASSPGDVTSNTVTSFSPFTFGSLTGANPLPIKLINFSANLNTDKKVNIHWQTVSEVDNAYFTVERSRDGVNFEFVERIAGAGNSDNLISYSTIDPMPYFGISYYRLKQTDIHEKSTYSNIVMINHILSGNAAVALYPNPAIGTLNLDLGSETEGTLTIEDAFGNVKSTIEIINSKMTLDLSGLNQGIYFITIQSEESTKRVKFIKL